MINKKINKKVEIIRGKKYLGSNLKVEFKEVIEESGYELDCYELTYYNGKEDKSSVGFRLVSKEDGNRYSKKEILLIMFEEIITYHELLKIDEEDLDNYMRFRIETLGDLFDMLYELFGEDFEKFYYLYGLNPDVGNISSDDW